MDGQPSAPAATDPRPRSFSGPLLALALVVWATTTFGHKTGLRWAGQLFDWAKVPGNLHAAGGAEGMAVLEGRMAIVFASAAVVVLAWVLWRVRKLRPGARAIGEELVTWGAWAFLLLSVWKCFIVYSTELIHFGQYAVVGSLMMLALRRPQQAFLCTFGLGFVDELYQHYYLHVISNGDPHWMDWSDEVLDALGAVGGILPFVSYRRLSGEQAPDTFSAVRTTLACAALFLLPLLLLDPITSSKVLGTYPSWYPTWQEYANHKPTHWPAPRQGIPVVLAAIFLLGTLIEHRRRGVSQAGLLLLAALVFLAIDPHSRRRGMPVHEVVPEATIPRVPAGQTIAIDGKLDDAAWAAAKPIGPLVNNRYLGPEGRLNLGPIEPARSTQARLLWDDQALYVAFECDDPDVWARKGAARDDRALDKDEAVFLFLDDGGDEVTWVELQVTPAGVVHDVWTYVPAAPVDHDPDRRWVGLFQWDAQGLEVAVHVDGTLDTPETFAERGAEDQDRGWTVEVRFPWDNLRTTTTPSSNMARFNLPPKRGDQWRMNLCRVESPRPTPAERGDPTTTCTEDEARALLLEGDESMTAQQVTDALPHLLHDPQGRHLRAGAVIGKFQHMQQRQAWAPTWGDGGFHQPRWFGAVTFGE